MGGGTALIKERYTVLVIDRIFIPLFDNCRIVSVAWWRRRPVIIGQEDSETGHCPARVSQHTCTTMSEIDVDCEDIRRGLNPRPVV